MELSSEVQAMAAIEKEFQSLDEDARRRVLAWATSKYGTSASAPVPGSPLPQQTPSAEATPQFSTFADLLDAADPNTEADRTLVGAYWFQVVNGRETFTAQKVNDELKNTGHRVSNITRTLDRLQKGKPALVRQVRKSGKAKQARKTYKLTEAGIRQVHDLIARKAESLETQP